jgi:hypothetical protein
MSSDFEAIFQQVPIKVYSTRTTFSFCSCILILNLPMLQRLLESANHFSLAEDKRRSYITSLRPSTSSREGIPHDAWASCPRFSVKFSLSAVHSPHTRSFRGSSTNDAKCHWMLTTYVPEDHLSKKELFDDSTPLVLTHQDLNLRNIILGEDSRLWIHEPDIIHLVLEKKLTPRYLLF